MRVEDLAILVGSVNNRGIVDAQVTTYKEDAEKVVEAINQYYPEEKDYAKRDELFTYLLNHQICGKELVELFDNHDKSVEKLVASIGDMK